jgi:hypothetical protein
MATQNEKIMDLKDSADWHKSKMPPDPRHCSERLVKIAMLTVSQNLLT